MYQCFCTHCGTRLTPQARFCQGCAAAVNLPTAPTAEAPAPTPAPKTAAPTKDKTKPKGRKFSAGVLFLSLMLGFSLALTLLLGEIRVMSTVELPQQTVDFLLEQVDLTQEDLAVLTGQLEQLGIGEILLSDEVLMALTISALTNPLAELAQQQLPKLQGSNAHFTVVLSDVDAQLLKKLGINVSCEAKYETKKLYHK